MMDSANKDGIEFTIQLEADSKDLIFWRLIAYNKFGFREGIKMKRFSFLWRD